MREIKFRAKSLCKGEDWVYGDLRHYNRNPRTEKWTIHDPETGIETDIEPSTVGQYTGLFDNQGKEIYEGDFLSNGVDGHFSHPIKMFPYFDDGNYDYENNLKKDVIGNIHDNPELMEGEK